ncbi:MAG: hypothetical protein BM556_03180 [Bacteriovorax sp. MedPE-SWde]|nr:MAG: hypothetical protein BM556_03180 [Bacteriovorax sp. MedPE-SWde]
MKISDVMTRKPVTAGPLCTVEEVAALLLEHNVGGVPIIDNDNNLIGILTESDFIGRRVNVPHAMVSLTKLLGETHYNADVLEVFDRAKSLSVEKVMTRKVITMSPDSSLTDANQAMVTNNVSRLPIVKNGKLVGIITKRDILKVFASSFSSSHNLNTTSASL